MRANLILELIASIFIAVSSYGQDSAKPLLNIGDPAPRLRVKEWLKGEPIHAYKKGAIYVVEFWATWCVPCKAAMPHLSALARKYRGGVEFVGVDVMDNKATSAEVKAFVEKMGEQIDYNVAVEDSNFMEKAWLVSSGERGIPKSYIVNSEGQLAWIGHPGKLEGVLTEVINNTWNIEAALHRRNLNKHLAELDDSLYYELLNYYDKNYIPGDLGRPDSALLLIDEIVKKEPGLKFAPLIALHTFSALLKTNIEKAYEYGRMAITTATYTDPAYSQIVGIISKYSAVLNLPPKIYELGAKAWQAEIDDTPYPELVNIPMRYSKMAEWYCRAGEKMQAINAQQKAIDELKRREGFSKETLISYEAQLKSYKVM